MTAPPVIKPWPALLISAGDVAPMVAAGRPVTLLDVRWRLGGPPGRELYAAGHIPGAMFVDLDRDLAAPPGVGGRHPMPSAADFEAAMRRVGVRDSRPVVVYDDADSTAAARAWWLLRYFGHQAVAVLDGGFRAWTAAGGTVETGPAETGPPDAGRAAAGDAGSARPGATGPGGAGAGDFRARPGQLGLLGPDAAAALARDAVLLDARSAERYRGEAEHIDPVAGHIPGAVSAPTAANVNPDGTFRPATDLAERFRVLGAAGDRPVAAYCGSGVTAAHEVLALTLAGIPAGLYVGSWSDWITDPARPVAKGPTP
jgi:thiosulfate/3-mercaptopyruvate sulfurtransferase